MPEDFIDVVEERELYDPLVTYLNSEFRHVFQPKFGVCRIIARDTSSIAAAAGGMWTRPDVSAIAVSRHHFEPAPRLDVITFEAKRKTGLDLAGIYETLAHTRFAHLSYLVWHTPNRTAGVEIDTDVRKSCEEFGVGLISVFKPRESHTYVVECEPQRREHGGSICDDFIMSRFSEAEQNQIMAALRDLRP